MFPARRDHRRQCRIASIGQQHLLFHADRCGRDYRRDPGAAKRRRSTSAISRPIVVDAAVVHDAQRDEFQKM